MSQEIQFHLQHYTKLLKLYIMKNLLKISLALLLSIAIISCSSNTQESTETKTEPQVINFDPLEIKIQSKLKDFLLEEDGIIHSLIFDSKSIRLSGEPIDSETMINEFVLNLQETSCSVKGNGNSPTLNAGKSGYKLSSAVDFVVGENNYPSTVHYNTEVNEINGVLEINLDGTVIQMTFKGRK